MRSVHDVGGLDFGAVPLADHARETWEKRTNGISLALRQRKLATLDEQRRHVENLGASYHGHRYFERQLLAWAQIVIDRGLITSAELGRMLADPPERPPIEAVRGAPDDPAPAPARSASPARFKPGDRVRVLKSEPPGHVRTPWYCRGHAGVIERICGAFPNPEELAYRRPGLPATPLYRVRFRSRELWPDYGEDPADTVDIEIYEHWLAGA
jgi:nitrile hydratase